MGMENTTSITKKLISETQKTILNQINWRVWAISGYQFVTMGETAIRVHSYRKHKSFDITYNEGLDLYDIQKHTINRKTFEVKTEHLEGIFFDQLQELMMDFFNIRGE